MAASDKNKNKFSWNAGESITPESYEPLGKVRDKGIIHLGEALPADDSARQEVLEEKLARKKGILYSKVVDERNAPEKPKNLLIEGEDSQSDGADEAAARKLLEKEPQRGIRGSGLFGKK